MIAKYVILRFYIIFIFLSIAFQVLMIRERYHVVLKDNLARQSRDDCQTHCHKSQKQVLYQTLQENETLIFAFFEHILTVLTLVTVVT